MGVLSPQETSRNQVLLVEGQLDRRQQLYELLNSHGLRVVAVRTGHLALETLKHERPDVLLIGGTLSDMTGEALVAHVRTFDATTPVIRVSRDVSEERLVAEIGRQLPKPAAQLAGPTGTILLVDDNSRLVSILQSFLQLHGLAIVTAGSGEEAIDRLKACMPRVVLLDMRMPGMDGLLTLRKIRTLAPALPVIFISQVDEESVLEEAKSLGVDEYLTKPLNFEHLKTILLAKLSA